jgi:uncharacterized membrane protein
MSVDDALKYIVSMGVVVPGGPFPRTSSNAPFAAQPECHVQMRTTIAVW